MATEQLMVRLSMQAQQYKREAREAATATGKISGQAKQASTATGGLTTKMGGLGSVLKGAAITGGLFAVGRAVGNAVERAEEMSSAYAITEQVIRQTGGAANLTAEDIKALSRQQSILTGVDKALVTEGNNVLLTFKNIKNEVGEGNDVFNRTSNLMLDVATVMNSDAKGAAIQLGKALNDPVANMGALSRSGLTFTQQQKDQIKTLAESGRLLEAQDIILSELETQLGGTAAASADASDKVSNAFKEISESVGVGLLPMLDDLADGLAIAVGMSPAVADLTDTIKEIGEVNLSDLFQVGEVLGITDFRDTMTEIIETANLTDEELRELASGGIEQLKEEFKLTDSRAAILAEVIAEAREETRELGRASGSSAGEVDVLADAADDAAGAFDDQESAIDRTLTALGGYEDAQRRLTDPMFKAIDDHKRLRDAQDEYTAAVEEFGEKSPEAVDAGFDLAAAQQAVNDGLQGLPEDMKAAEDSIALFGQEAGITDETLRAMRDTINSFDGLTANATIGINVVGGERIEGININKNVVLRQHGGPVRAGDPYVVGEAGPELFIPQQSGMVVANNQTATSGSAVGATIINNNFTLTWGDFVRKAADAGLEIQRYGW